MSRHKLACIGVDQSYKRTGISLTIDGHLRMVTSVDLAHYPEKRDCRVIVPNAVHKVVSKCLSSDIDHVLVLMERVRLYSKQFISQPYIMSMGAMNAAISDKVILSFPVHAAEGRLEVMSVETRAWKAAVVGTIKKEDNPFGAPPEKWPTIKLIQSKYPEFREKIMHPSKRQKKSKKNFSFLSDDAKSVIYMEYDDDACDSACISMFPWSRPDWSSLLISVD